MQFLTGGLFNRSPLSAVFLFSYLALMNSNLLLSSHVNPFFPEICKAEENQHINFHVSSLLPIPVPAGAISRPKNSRALFS